MRKRVVLFVAFVVIAALLCVLFVACDEVANSMDEEQINAGNRQSQDREVGTNSDNKPTGITEDNTPTNTGVAENEDNGNPDGETPVDDYEDGGGADGSDEMETQTGATHIHEWTEWKVTKQPTCQIEGEEIRSCRLCDTTDTRTISKTAHISEPIAAVAPTCTQSGLTEGSRCSVCGEMLEAQRYVAPTHSYGAWSIYSAPTCTEEGMKYRVCVGCGNIERQMLYAEGHKGEWFVTEQPTCTTSGKRTRTCTVCAQVFVEDIAATAHLFGEKETIIATTCGVGKQRQQCAVCGLCQYEALAPDITKQHQYGDDEICDVCGEHKPTEGLQYTIIGNTATVKKYTGTETTVYIPHSYMGVVVTEIEGWAFMGRNDLACIEIPFTVTTIQTEAFHGCWFNTVRYTGDMYGWLGIEGVKYLTEYCSYSTSLYMMNDLLENVVIPNGIVSIASFAFPWFSSVKSICLPKSIQRVEEDAFRYDSRTSDGRIADVYYAGDMEDWFLIHGLEHIMCSIDIDKNLYFHDTKVVDLVVPDSIKRIPTGAFCGCTGITSLIIGSGVTSIDAFAFAKCSGLRTLDIPDNVTNIDTSAFSECNGLTSIAFGEGITTIGGFGDGRTLTSISIGSRVTSIKCSSVFYASNLQAIYYAGDIAGWCAISGLKLLMERSPTTKSLYIGGQKVEKIVTPNGVTSIGDYAFCNCGQISSVVLGDSVISIGVGAFANCRDLITVAIGEGVIIIGEEAFGECYQLASITIGSNVTSIGNNAFTSCGALNTLTIPASVVSIGEGAFSECRGLSSVDIGSNVSVIDGWAFSNCENLEIINYAETVKQWQAITRAGNWNLHNKTIKVVCSDGTIYEQ